MALQQVNLISNWGGRFSYYHHDDFLIGRGAMGEVYKGWRTDSPAEKMAIKRVYPRHAAHPSIRQRARFEATLSIKHPNLITMLGYCEHLNSKNGFISDPNQQSSIYIVSEFVEGTTIDRFTATTDPAMRTEIVSKMICSVLDGLHCLHTLHPKPVWHRDIKPSNIMVENGRHVKIMDLGIAIADGISFGTLDKGFGSYPYAPPEQITGKREDVNALSDIYSTGVSFYELLTGVNPFLGGSEVDIMDKQITMALPPDPRIPQPLYKVLLKATAKKQSNRYQSVTEFKEAIRKALDPDTVPLNWPLLLGIAGGILLVLSIIIFAITHG
ncbi:MAG: serine/threonine protein kinase [Tannerella sp.]|jgi:serine/threonine-protein kinase|nr:serine/threonine protein kinase [Tannerella sp.]